jgi:pilus assembly protein Flp/PilA
MNHLYQRGQGLVEYAMIMVLVAIIVIIILALFGSSVGNMFSSVIAMF